MASRINNLNTVTSYMQHFQLLKLFLLYAHVKMASSSSGRPRDSCVWKHCKNS